MKEVDGHCEQKHSHHRKSGNQFLVLPGEAARILAREYALIKALLEVPEYPAAVSGENQPAYKKQAERDEKMMFSGTVGIVDVKYEEDNNEIDDVVEHGCLSSVFRV